jgi:GntR family transcriptional regulator, transcriptional repressor for pyruvate dehydrogenase complex
LTEGRPPAGVPSTRAEHPRIAREIAGSLQRDIARGTLARGTRLPSEKDLARHYGVSQPTVREAIRALDLMGFLDVRHGSGVYVSGDTRDYVAGSLTALLESTPVNILHVLELRGALGEISARRAAQHATDAELARMRGFLEAASAVTEHSTVAEIVGPGVSFNLAVAAASRNPLLYAVESFTIKLVTQIQLNAKAHRGPEFWRERQTPIIENRLLLLDRLYAHDEDGAVALTAAFLDEQSRVFRTDPELSSIEVIDTIHLTATIDDQLELPTFSVPVLE